MDLTARSGIAGTDTAEEDTCMTTVRRPVPQAAGGACPPRSSSSAAARPAWPPRSSSAAAASTCVVVEPRTTARPAAAAGQDHQRPHDGAPAPLGHRRPAARRRAAAGRLAQDVVFATGLLGHEITRFRERFRPARPTPPATAAGAGQQAPQPVVEEVLREAAAELPTVTAADRLPRRPSVERRTPTACARPSTRPGDGRDRHRRRRPTTCSAATAAAASAGRAIGAATRARSGDDAQPVHHCSARPALEERVPCCAPAVHYWVIGARRRRADGPAGPGRHLVGHRAGRRRRDRDVDPVALVRRCSVGRRRHRRRGASPPTPGHARMLLADRYRGGRVFLVGDAAHLNPPWGGHGFNTCVGDAVNIGWKLAAVLQGWARDALLDSYEPERRPVAAQTIAAAGAQESSWRRLRSTADARRRDEPPPTRAPRLAAALQVKDREFHSLGLVLGYDYADSPVVVDDGSPVPPHDPIAYHGAARPGARLPHVWLDGDTSVLDVLGPGFTVLHTADPRSTDSPRPRPRAACRSVSPSFRPEVADRYGAAVLLVRPDQHVAWRGDDDHDAATVLALVTGRAGTEDQKRLAVAGGTTRRD